MGEFMDRCLESLGAGQAGTHHHVSLLPVGDTVGFTKPVNIGDLEVETGFGDESTNLFPMRGEIPIDECDWHLRERVAVGLGDVKDVDDPESDDPLLFLLSAVEGDFADDGCEDLESPLTLTHVAAEFLPRPIAGNPARGRPSSDRLGPDQTGVGERIVMEPGSDGQRPLPILGGDEFLERVLELLVELIHRIVSAGLVFCCFHTSIVPPNPLTRMPTTLSSECQQPSHESLCNSFKNPPIEPSARFPTLTAGNSQKLRYFWMGRRASVLSLFFSCHWTQRQRSPSSTV
ncbi:MAG: hypothetical protein M5U23_04270 [Acidimicrobiia bacterium]|nr:hypothetical protein [Acidimicrobiia bacterium]